MPSVEKSMGVASPTTFVAERADAKIIPSLIMVDNVIPAQNAILEVVDHFKPDPSDGKPSPIDQDITRLAINVSQDACVSIRDELKDMEILGRLDITIETLDADCKISVAYDFE